MAECGALSHAGRLPGGRSNPAFRTKPQSAIQLIEQARAAGVSFRAVVADCFYGERGLHRRAVGSVRAGAQTDQRLRGPRSRRCTPRPGRPGSGPGVAPTIQGPGPRCDAGSEMAAPSPGRPPMRCGPVTGPTRGPAGGSPPPPQAGCRPRRPGTWPPTCPAPTAHAPAFPGTARRPGRTGAPVRSAYLDRTGLQTDEVVERHGPPRRRQLLDAPGDKTSASLSYRQMLPYAANPIYG